MRTFYRRQLIEAVNALIEHGDLNMRLTHAAGCLLQIDDRDVPIDVLAQFNRVRGPLIDKPIVTNGGFLPRDLEPIQARASARAIMDLLVAEMG